MSFPMKRICLFAVFAAIASPVLAQKHVPTVDQMVELKRPSGVSISPDGRYVAYVVREADWEEGAFDTEIWLADSGTAATRQLTRGKKSSTSPAWSPDGSTLAFISDRGDKRQVYLIDPLGGEARVLTSAEDGVGATNDGSSSNPRVSTSMEPPAAGIVARNPFE